MKKIIFRFWNDILDEDYIEKDKCSDDSVIYLQEYQDKEEALRLEKHYIRMLKPKFNSRYCQPEQLELLHF